MSSVADVASVADVIDEIDVTIPNRRTTEQPNRGVRVCSVLFVRFVQSASNYVDPPTVARPCYASEVLVAA